MAQEEDSSSDICSDNLVMPSLVVRQQKIQMMASKHKDSTDGQHQAATSSSQSHSSSSTTATPSLSDLLQKPNLHSQHPQQRHMFDQDGLVLPKRIIQTTKAAQPIIKDLNRELKFNKICGKNVLDQKSELKKAMEKLESSKRKKEAEQDRLSRRTSLEIRLEERAEKIAQKDGTAVSGATASEQSCGSNISARLSSINSLAR